jgi:hypothetical protein
MNLQSRILGLVLAEGRGVTHRYVHVTRNAQEILCLFSINTLHLEARFLSFPHHDFHLLSTVIMLSNPFTAYLLAIFLSIHTWKLVVETTITMEAACSSSPLIGSTRACVLCVQWSFYYSSTHSDYLLVRFPQLFDLPHTVLSHAEDMALRVIPLIDLARCETPRIIMGAGKFWCGNSLHSNGPEMTSTRQGVP